MTDKKTFEIQKIMIPEDMKLLEAMQRLNQTGMRVLLVCEGDILLAILNDSDIRRFIVNGGDLNQPVKTAANYDCKTVTLDQVGKASALIRQYKINCVPVLDKDRRVVSIVFEDVGELILRQIDVPVVVMAGGEGTRLYPYTKILPKPLIPIGDKTITEHILDRFRAAGCRKYIMIVNHKKNMIKAYFSDQRSDYNLQFVDEDQPMGTGGGLRLLEGRFDDAFFMTNCDILVEYNYSKIYEYHKKQHNIITVVSAVKTVEIPYGIIETDAEGKITQLQEKPSYSFLTNTGLYVIEPAFLEYIPEQPFVHITDLITACVAAGERVGVFPIHEGSWYDMGQFDAMKVMLGYVDNKEGMGRHQI